MHLTQNQLFDVARILTEIKRLDDACHDVGLDFDGINVVGKGIKVHGYIEFRDAEWVFVPIGQE